MDKEASILLDHPTSCLCRVAKLFDFPQPKFHVVETNRAGAIVQLMFKQTIYEGQHSHNLNTT